MEDRYHHSVGITGNHDDSQDLVSKFYLSGYHRVHTDGVDNCDREYTETSQHSYLFYLPNVEETECYFAGDRIHLVRIYWGLDFLQTISRGLDKPPVLLQKILEGDRSTAQFHLNAGHLTDAMQTTLQQLVQAPYCGLMQRLFLESKVLELLALQLMQLQEPDNATRRSPIKSSEIEQVHQAKEILLSDLVNPPTILELAQQVGLHHMKLKQGFRQVFGTTVFGYLSNHRMELARHLLSDRQLSVTAVANTVGYANQGHFAAAFRRQFGVTPTACRKGQF
jgi:AraC-like DNA-binding protein